MRHHNSKRKFGRERNQRVALLRSLANSLIMRGKITTTLEKAKEVRPFVEKLVTKAKNPSLSTIRLLYARTGSSAASKKIISDISSKYKSRNGGYTRITRTGKIRKDGGVEAQIEFV